MLVVFLPACTSEFGTAADAKAMLEKAVAELKKDKTAALAKFSSGEGGFKNRDLYPFCAGTDGIVTAHPTELGRNLNEVKDKDGKAFGQEMLEEGKFNEVAYMWPKPGSAEPAQKVSYIVKVGDQICGAGYYTR
ncbi:MAG: cache domain-containing protein [Chromatiales bacterium]